MLELRRRYGSSAGGGQPSRLPAGYQEVEYIEGTKGAYINPNISIGEYSAVEVEFMITDVSESIYHTDIFGYSGAAANFCARYESRQTANIFMTSGVIGSLYAFELNKRYNLKINTRGNKEAIINDINELVINSSGGVPAYPAYLMASYGLANGKPYAAGCQRNYLSKFYEDGSLIRDLIPCRRLSDNEKGMYDIVNDVFYTNAGTGEFLCGADVGGGQSSILPQEYQLVDWLDNGNDTSKLPYIKTDIYPSTGLGFEIECAFPTAPYGSGVSCDGTIFGCDKDWYYNGYSLAFNNTYASSSLGVIFHMYASMISDISATKFYPNTNEFYKYKFLNGECYIDDELVLNNNPVSSDAIDVPIVIFGLQRGSQVYTDCENLKIKGLRFFNEIETNTVAHFLPCYRKADMVAGMYDIVEGKFHTNQGEGEFIVGPDIID